MIGDNLEASTEGCVCDGKITLLDNNSSREHLDDTDDIDLEDQNNINRYGVYKVLELLNIPLPPGLVIRQQYYSNIDISKITALNFKYKSIDDSVSSA